MESTLKPEFVPIHERKTRNILHYRSVEILSAFVNFGAEYTLPV